MVSTKRLKPLDGAEHAVDAAVGLSARQGGVVRVAAEPHFALFRDGDHALEKVRYPVPHLLIVGGRAVQGRRALELGVVEAAVAGAATAGDRASAQHPQQSEIVLDGGDPDLARVADHLTDSVDFAIALRAFAENDVGHLRPGDERAAHRQRDHVERNAGFLDAVAQLRQAVHGPRIVEPARGQGAADVLYAKGGEDFEVGVGGVVLVAELHATLLRGIGLRRLVGAERRPQSARAAPVTVRNSLRSMSASQTRAGKSRAPHT